VPDGIGTALKPAVEFWFLARKPLDGTYAENVLKHGTGGLNIGACRVQGGPSRGGSVSGDTAFGQGLGWSPHDNRPTFIDRSMAAGRWPANLMLSHVGGPDGCREVGTRRVKSSGDRGSSTRSHAGLMNGTSEPRPTEGTGYADADGLETVAEWRCVEGCPILELDRQSGERPGCKSPSSAKCESKYRPDQGAYQPQGPIYPDSGGASRFFATFGYFPKASRANRGQDNRHPTVKNTDMMRWLCRLIVPEGGIVLDPFMGSGSTLIAAEAEGFSAIGIDSDPESVATARRRWANKLAETPLFSQDMTPCESA
jgi:hypothetical protein